MIMGWQIQITNNNVNAVPRVERKMLLDINRERLFKGLVALPSFPVVYVTVDRNIMVAAAFHFYSFEPPSVMVGIKPEKYSYQLVLQKGEFGISIPTKSQLDNVSLNPILWRNYRWL